MLIGKISAAVIACAASQAAQARSEGFEFIPMPIEVELDSIYDAQSIFRTYDPLFGEPAGMPGTLDDDDYRAVAELLGIEVAAIKAVVEIETGNKHEGFWAQGKPLINFDLSIYRQRASRHGVSLDAARRSHPIIFRSPDVRRYGSRQAAQQARLDAAMEINEDLALESVFWGMFQIGGFNWDKCGTESVQEFVALMSRSERDQLELFAAYCVSRDLVKYIRNHDWAAFALRYNGPGYERLNYHNKMAAAYNRHRNR